MQKILIFLLGLLVFSCHQNNQKIDQSTGDRTNEKKIIILYTNDEHGWMEPSQNRGGAPGLMALWKSEVDFQSNGPFLILSGGDMWTGPAISTITEGKSMVEVMNAMGYMAAALGNHEFDYTVNTLQKRVTELNFPILAANIREKENGKRPDFVLPFYIKQINDVSIGIIGLTTLSTPTTTKPANVAAYDFIPYASALKEIVPEVKAAGAELLILIGHICYDEMVDLAPLALELGISVIGGGHCHELYEEKISDVTLIQSGSNMENYVKVDILFDDRADTVMSIVSSTHTNQTDILDTVINHQVSKWRMVLNIELKQVIGYTAEEIPEKSDQMQNMITDAWLYMYPAAQIALTNTGGIRQSIPKGNITIETILGVLPFQNNILELELNGKEVIDCLHSSIVMGGMTTMGGYQLSDGRFLHNDSTYRVLVNDYIYSVSYMNYKKYDTEPYDTSISYRQPLIEWIKSMNSSTDKPLNNYLDKTPRKIWTKKSKK